MRWRAIVVLCRIAFAHHPGWTSALCVLAVADALLAPAAAALTGAVIAVVERGEAAGRLVPLLAGYAALRTIPVGEFRWRVSDTIGNRIGDVLDQRVMHAYLDPPGIAHLDDAEVRDAADRAVTFWNSSMLEGTLSVLVVRMTGVAGAVLLGVSGGWFAAGVLATVWWAAGRWSWRVAGEAMDVTFEKSPELRDADYTARLGVDPQAAKEVRVFGLTSWLLGRHHQQWTAAMEPLWSRRRRATLPSAAVAVAVAVANAGVVVWLGARAVDGSMSLAQLAVAVQAMLQVASLGSVPFGHWEMEYGLRSVPANEALARLVAAPRFQLTGTRSAAALPRESIRFERVGFAYAGFDRKVLDGVDLEIPAGTSLAVVGDNGAGKTTLVKLLCRFLDPTDGQIVVDGVPLHDIDSTEWHARIAGLFQDFLRYPLSARENVALDTTVDDRIVRAAAASAGILDVIEALPEAWDTQLTRRFVGGIELSGGQWQRVALARALVGVARGAGVLVLDEPTAQLDAKAEADLYDRFLELTRGVTTILISHRFSTVRRAERIAVLAEGRITELGSHEELVAAGGHYAHLFSLQAAKFAAGESAP